MNRFSRVIPGKLTLGSYLIFYLFMRKINYTLLYEVALYQTFLVQMTFHTIVALSTCVYRSNNLSSHHSHMLVTVTKLLIS